jgi:probable F420-dependent oxidoreductase
MLAAMPRPFRFAAQGGPFTDGSALAEHARRVESLGYQELYSYDHVGHVDPFAPLVAAAAATERLGIGPLTVDNDWHHPVLLARTAATVDALSGGRLVLGMGTGHSPGEHEAIGAPLRPPGPRVSRFAESLTVLRALLDTGSVDFDGEHHQVHLADLGVRPGRDRVPFLIGGHGRRVVGLAGRHADIFQFTGLRHGADGEPDLTGFALAELDHRARWLAESAGERDAAIERSALVQVVGVGPGAPTPDDVAARFSIAPEVARETPFALVGSVGQIGDELHRLRERLGISHWVIREPEVFAPVVEALDGK